MPAFNGFTCDKCKKEFRSTDKNYSPVAIYLSFDFGKTTPTDRPNTERSAVWCRECLMREGIYRPTTEDDKKVAPDVELSFEEQFAKLIEGMGFVRDR